MVKEKDAALNELHTLNDTQKAIYSEVKARLDALELEPAYTANADGADFPQMLERNNVSRRDFMKWAGVMTAMLSLPAAFTPLTAKAAAVANRIPVIWMHMAECTGCSESLLRTQDPGVANLIFNYINLDYHETIMAASGYQAEKTLKDAMERYKGKYIMMVEGATPSDTHYLTMGANSETGYNKIREVAKDAAAILAIGTCSSYGGVQAAYPNPTGAKALSEVITKPVINVPGCPPNDKNIVGNILYYIMFGALPPVDAFARPTWAYGRRIHDLCERRGHFDAGEFVQEFGDEGATRGYCLYKMGCKGPYTFNNCSKLRFNAHTNWPIGAGHGCIGCSEPNFWDTMQPYERPLANRLFESVFKGLGADRTADYVGIALLSATAIGIAAHAVVGGIKKD